MSKQSDFRRASKSDEFIASSAVALLGIIIRSIVAIPLLFVGFVFAYAHQVEAERRMSWQLIQLAFMTYGLIGTGTWLLVKPKGFGAGFLLTFSGLPLTVCLCWLLGFPVGLGWLLFPLIMIVDALSMRFFSAHIVLLVTSPLVTIKKDYEKTINRWKSDV